MEKTRAPEFKLGEPLRSGLAVIGAVLRSPRVFYRNFSLDGPVREPVVFVLLVSAVAGVLRVVVSLIFSAIFGGVTLAEVGLTVLEALLFVVLSPAAVGLAAAVYLLSIRTFVGQQSNLREVYRMLAYAYGAMILAWIPVVDAFVITYILMVLMGIGIRAVYRTTFLTALVTALVGYVPVSTALILLRLLTAEPFA
ncbi:MAG: YIP1 family protein [Actinomycetota bacterium]|nr:YIP1 family protein [Actinomycetota bacterium]